MEEETAEEKLKEVLKVLELWRICRSKDDVVTLSTGAIKKLQDYIKGDYGGNSELGGG